MLLLPAKATTEETANTCTDQPRPRTTEHDKLFNVIWSHASRHIIINIRGEVKRRQANLEWAGFIGSLISATIASNFEISELLSRGVLSFSSL